jgi:nitric oxide reductase NorE protein
MAISSIQAAGSVDADVAPLREERRLPGVEGVWAFVFADMTTFAVMFISFMIDQRKNPALFEQSRQALNRDFGGINTLILLTSSMLVVLAIDALKHGWPRLAPRFLVLAMACGFAFMLSKAFEYTEKFKAGITLLTNDFFMYYFVLTGIHLVHVIAGNVVLAVLWFKSRSQSAGGGNLRLYESGATYWHMVDLLWICLFPLLYLVR